MKWFCPICGKRVKEKEVIHRHDQKDGLVFKIVLECNHCEREVFVGEFNREDLEGLNGNGISAKK